MRSIIQGNGGTNAEVSANSRALYVTPRPPDIGSYGAYALSIVTDQLTGVINRPVFSFRWTSTSIACVVNRLVLWRQCLAHGGGQEMRLEAFVARNFSAADTGGTTATISGNNCKKRTSFATTAVSEIRYSTNASIATAGTRTLDGVAFLRTNRRVSRNLAPEPELLASFAEFNAFEFGGQGIVLQGESGVVVNFAETGTTNAEICAITIEWSEVDPLVYFAPY